MSNRATSRRSSPAFARTTSPTADAGVASGTTIARSRSTAWNRPTAGARSRGEASAGEPVERHLGDDDPLGVRSSHVSTTAGCSSPTIASSRPSIRPRAVRPGGRGFVSLGGVPDLAETEPLCEQVQEPLGVIEVVRTRHAVPRRGLGGPDEGEPEPPPLVRLVARERVALPDLEHGDVRRAVAQVRAHDVQDAAEQVASQEGVVARERVPDADRRAAGLRLVADRRDLAPQHERLHVARAHERRGDGLRQAGAGQRLADEVADLDRRRAVVGMAVSGVTDGTSS